MRKHGKKYTAARQQVEDRPYALDEALPLVQKVKFAKFDETVELRSAWASIPSTPIRWCAAPSSCRTVWARPSACW